MASKRLRKKRATQERQRAERIARAKALEQAALSQGYAVPQINVERRLPSLKELITRLKLEQPPIKEIIQTFSVDDIALYNFQSQMVAIFGRNPPLLEVIKRWYNEAYNRLGKDDFLEMLNDSYSRGLWPTWEAVSDGERLSGSLADMLSVSGISSGAVADIMETTEKFSESNY